MNVCYLHVAPIRHTTTHSITVFTHTNIYAYMYKYMHTFIYTCVLPILNTLLAKCCSCRKQWKCVTGFSKADVPSPNAEHQLSIFSCNSRIMVTVYSQLQHLWVIWYSKAQTNKIFMACHSAHLYGKAYLSCPQINQKAAVRAFFLFPKWLKVARGCCFCRVKAKALNQLAEYL